MRRLATSLLYVIPALLIVATLGTWGWHATRPKSVFTHSEEPANTDTQNFDGVTFEVEWQPSGERYNTVRDDTSIGFRRGPDQLDYEDGVIVFNGVGFPGPKAGDVVRWNLDGPLLINGQTILPHPHQPRELEYAGTEPWWVPRPSSALTQRDTLTVNWPRLGGVVVTASGDGGVRAWDTTSQKVLTLIRHDSPLVPRDTVEGNRPRSTWGLIADISPEASTIVTGYIGGAVIVPWDAKSGLASWPITSPGGKLRAVRFLSETWLFTVWGERAYAQHISGERVVELGKVHHHFPDPFALSGDGHTLVLNDGEFVKLRRLSLDTTTATATPPESLLSKLGENAVLALSHDGRQLAVFDGRFRLGIYDTTSATGQPRVRLRWRGNGNPLQITAMAFSPDRKTLAIGDVETMRLYDVESGREWGWTPASWVRSLAFAQDGMWLAAGLRTGAGFRLWNVPLLTQPKQ